MRTRRGALLLVILSAAVAGAGPAHAEAEGFTGEIQLTLLNALVREDGRRVNLVLHLAADAGRWECVWGHALNYNNGKHVGVVNEAAVDDRWARLDVAVRIGRDRWAKGGRADYAIDMQRTGPRRLRGTFKGTFCQQAVSGTAYAEVKPPRPIQVKGFRPVAPGEHPRVLFRKADLPGLKAKLKTSLGRAYLDKAKAAGDLVSLGMLYQLTGEAAYAERALARIKEYAAEAGGGIAKHAGPGSGGFGHRFVRVCLAYDLCFDAWPADFKEWLRGRMFQKIALFQSRLPTGHANYHPCSNYYGPGRGVPAIASLCLWGVKGPAPPKPRGPRREPVPPAAGYKPGKGVPVSAFADGQMPGEWIYVGGFRPARGEDPLAGLGGPAKARPQVGTKVSFGERTETFRPVSHEKDKGYWTNEHYTHGKPAIDVTNAIGRVYYSTSYFYTVVRSDRPRWVEVATGHAPTTVYLAGVRARQGDVLRIGKGLYPMLVASPIGETRPWGRILVQPRLVERTAEQAADILRRRRAEHELAVALWRVEQRAWEKSGGVDPRAQRFVDAGYRHLFQHYRLGIGDGGFQAETGGYADIASWYPLVYASAYRGFFGRNASGYPDVTHLMPRRMMQVLFRPDGTTAVEKINSAVGVEAKWCAAAWPIVPERYRPALLWAWNHVAGVKGAATVANALQGEGLSLAHAFLHYPLDMAPAHPSKVMPLTWRAPTFGYYCFRSGWQGREEFIAQVFLKASLVKGWNHGNAGTFRIFGLGRGWVTTPESRNGVRAQEPVVYLGEDEHNENACGRLTFLQTRNDGSGALTVDLADVYATAKTRKTPRGQRKEPVYDSNLIRLPASFADSGISGLRAFAFDYSGAGGVPCLMVLVDRIRGGREKVWQWQLPEEAAAKTRVEANAFTIDQGDASMRATFVAPTKVKLSPGTERIKVRDARHGFHGEVTRVKATGGGEFFVVITFQRGRAPAVKVKGEGLAATAVVGRRTVRFDGRRIVLGR